MKDSAYDHIWVIESDSSDVTVMSPTVFLQITRWWWLNPTHLKTKQKKTNSVKVFVGIISPTNRGEKKQKHLSCHRLDFIFPWQF